LHAVDMVGSQYFPLYLYDEAPTDEGGHVQGKLALAGKAGSRRRDGISDAGLAHFKAAYPGERITKEDIFASGYCIASS
ncbi:MAG: type ISP restriction/modification enzyme, partial [Steroidobacteraceae bacterium]